MNMDLFNFRITKIEGKLVNSDFVNLHHVLSQLGNLKVYLICKVV